MPDLFDEISPDQAKPDVFDSAAAEQSAVGAGAFPEHGVEPNAQVISPGQFVGKSLNRAGNVTQGYVQDVAQNWYSHLSGDAPPDNPTANTEAAIAGKPTPYDVTTAGVDGAAGLAKGTAESVSHMIPALAAAGVGGRVLAATGLPKLTASAAAAGTTFGFTPDGFSPKQAAVMAAFPVVSEMAGGFVSAYVKSFLKPDISPAVQKAIQFAGSAAASQAYLDLTSLPDYLKMTPEERKKAWIQNFAINAAFHLKDVPGIAKDLLTEPKLKESASQAADSASTEPFDGQPASVTAEPPPPQRAGRVRRGALPIVDAEVTPPDVSQSAGIPDNLTGQIQPEEPSASPIRQNQSVLPKTRQITQGSETPSGNDLREAESGQRLLTAPRQEEEPNQEVATIDPTKVPAIVAKLNENIGGRNVVLTPAEFNDPRNAHLNLVLGKGAPTWQQLVDNKIVTATPAQNGSVNIQLNPSNAITERPAVSPTVPASEAIAPTSAPVNPGGAQAALPPEQQAISKANNSREAFLKANGGVLPTMGLSVETPPAVTVDQSVNKAESSPIKKGQVEIKIPNPYGLASDREKILTVTGTEFKIDSIPDKSWVVYKTGKGWRVVEKTAGLSPGDTYAETKSGAIAKAKQTVERIGPETVLKAIQGATKINQIPSETNTPEPKSAITFYEPKALSEKGYTPTGIKLKTKADYWEMQKVALETDTPQSSLSAFRMKDGTWEAYVIPGKKLGQGHASEPLLPKPSNQEPPSKPLDQPQKYRIGKSPQTFTLVERLPQSAPEKVADEHPVRVKNDKTGEVQTVLEADLTPVKDRSGEVKAPKRGLDKELRAAKMEPSSFQNDAQKREALKRYRAQQGLPSEIAEEGRTMQPAQARGIEGIRQILSQSNYPKHQIDIALDLLNRLERNGLDLSDLDLTLKQNSTVGGFRGSIVGNLMELTGKADAITFPHEMFHFLHELLPDSYKQALEDFRLGELRRIYGDNIPENLRGGMMSSQDFLDAGLPKEQYHLISTSEYLADFAGREFARESFAGRNEPDSFLRTMWNDIRRWVRIIVGTVKDWFKVRPDLRAIFQSLLDGRWKGTPESGKAYDTQRRASLAVNKEQYFKQEAFGERALPERTLAAYGDLSQIKNREANAVNASDQARRMVNIPTQDLLATFASTSMAVNRYVLDNYAQMKARVAGSDPGLKWSVTQDALHAVENEKVRAARTAQQFKDQSEKVNSPTFLKSVTRMFARETFAQDSQDALDTYKQQMAQAAGDIIRELDVKGKGEAEYDQLRADYKRVQQMQQFSQAVAQRVDDIINVVAASQGGLDLLYGLTDKTGTKIYNAYVDLKESTEPGSMANNASGKSEAKRFIASMGDYENLSQANKLKVDAARRVIESANLPGDQKIFARLASQVLAANTTLRWNMASKAYALANPTFKAAVTAIGEKFRKAFEQDPKKAIAQIIKASSSLTANAVNAESAWLRLQREVMPELKRYNDLLGATQIDARTAASPEYKALVKQIHDDAGAISIPSSERERGVTPQNAFNEFAGKQMVVSPTGGQYEINLGYTKASVVAAQAQMNSYLADMSHWLNDPANADSPDRKYWQMRADFVQNAINVSSVLAPTSTSSLGPKGSWTMMDFFFKGTALPSAKLSWIAGNNFFRSFNIADQWYNGVEGEWRTRAINAMRSHKMDVNTDMAVYQQQILNRLAAEYRAGHALKAGDRLNNGVVLTAQDLALLEYQGKSISALFNQVKNSGREKVMGSNLLVDSWNKNVFALRAPQEIGARVGTTLPHEFSQQAIALARRVAQTTTPTELYTLLDQPDIFQEFVQRFFSERRADYSTLSPFEDIYKEMASKWRDGASDAPHNLMEVIDFIDSRTTPDHTIATIHDQVLGEMGGQLRNFYKQYVQEESSGNDIRAVRATKNSAFTQGYQRDVGSSFYYDYGAMSSPEIRALGVDSTNFHLVRFVNSLDTTLKSYDEAMAQLTNARDKRALSKTQKSDFRSGKDFRNFQRLQAERQQLQYFQTNIATAYGSSHVAVIDLFSNMGGLLRDFTGAALTGLNTIGKVGVGSTVKMGLILQAFERVALMSYAKAAWSTVMSTAKVFAYSPKAALTGARAAKAAWSEGVGMSVARGLEASFESLFRQGKFFNQQYELGLGFKNPVGFRIYNELMTPYSGGMGYDAKLANNLLARWSQKAFYRVWSTAVRPPLEIVKAMFPQLAYAISYDATARAGGWTVDGIAAQARRSFEFLEKSGGLSAYDLNNPSNLQNILPVEYILPTGIFAKNQTNLNFARDWWQRALDIPLNEMVINYWKRLASTPAADRGSVSFLAADQTGADVKKFEDGRMAALMAILLKDVHHASPENRPMILRVDKTQRFLFPLVGWTTQSIRDTAYRLGVAPTDNMMKARMLAAAAALAFIAASTLGGESEKEVKKVLAAAMGEEYPVKMINEARNFKDAAKMLALDSVSVIPVLHDMMASFMGENGVHSAGTGITVFSVDRLNAMLHYINGVYKTGDWSYGLATLANQELPFAKTFTSKMESRQGLLSRKAVQTMVQKYGPEELTEKVVGGFAVPNELSPYKERLSNAIFKGDATATQAAMDAFVAQAVEMGKSPEEAQKVLAQTVVSLNPLQIGSSKMTQQQYADFIAKLSPEQLKVEQAAEAYYATAEAMVGRTTAITKMEPGSGGGGGGFSGTGSTGTRSRGSSGVAGVGTGSGSSAGSSSSGSGASSRGGGRIRGSRVSNRIRGRSGRVSSGGGRVRGGSLRRPTSHYRGSSRGQIRSHHKKTVA